MLTPRFELTQSDSEVVITVHAPYANIKDTEVYVDGTDFRFFSSPYYLRLKLPGEIEENDASSGSYDCEKGDFVFRFSKVHVGEHFENLDMITTLLAPPKKKTTVVPTIEVISNPVVNCEDSIHGNSNETTAENTSTNEGNEWFVPQNVPSDNALFSIDSPKYGFASKVSGALAAFEAAWTGEIIDLPLPDATPASERKCLREKHEFESFSEEHYMADLIQEEYLEAYIAFEPEWYKLLDTEISLDGTEKDILKELPNKEYLLDENEIQKVCCGMVDILFGNCYNYRVTMGDNTVESGWTINKLSSTLCWFQEFSNMEEVITACIRRSLCYPLYRNWNLSMKVFQDVKAVIRLGKKYIIKRFCEIHSLFNTSYEPRYILNQLYIKDYLIWLQQVPSSVIESLNSELDGINPKKLQMRLDLVELETAAYSVHEEDLVIENAVHGMVEQVADLKIDENDKEKLRKHSTSSSDSSDTDSETESDSSSSSSSSSDSSLDSDDTDVKE
ncbi:protein SHQ1 homolog isoform X2 [Cephus cinctus]|uniref:Protein SHQ1 homolog n=1 Tax=Cephus cinctus TaxID=211228 RepID=A0AAJ7BM86_CEPCN|nr:protein SHQ1 homolog isoform X2 [Cephus cinctus]